MEAYIYDAVRTPRGAGKASRGSLLVVSPIELAAVPLRALKSRSGLDTDAIDDVILGCVDPVKDQAGDIGRTAALAAGYGEEVPGLQINRFCASGLEAVALAASRVAAGQSDLIAAGGIEMMSRIGMGGSGMPPLTDPAVAVPHFMIPQGVSADLIATREKFSRDDVDAYAVDSQRRAASAWERGHFDRSVIPVVDKSGITILDRDETIRPDADMQSLGGLEPSFAGMASMAGFDAVAIQRYPQLEALQYVHHAGNSSQIVDGAAAVLVGSKAISGEVGHAPRARIRSVVSLGSEPTIMLTGPVEASRRAAAKAGCAASDIELWELNEAFASVVLYLMQELDVPHEIMNVNGGAIAMGHPLGATGAMILGTLVDELERADKTLGMATLCAASGQATAMVVERV